VWGRRVAAAGGRWFFAIGVWNGIKIKENFTLSPFPWELPFVLFF
jgi:hypothetical protein